MPSVTYVNANGSRKVVSVAAGTSIMEAAVENSIDGIVAQCGGGAICGTCHVYVNPDQLALLQPMSEDEEATLEIVAGERRANSRLACQIEMTPELEGLIVETPANQL